MMFRAAQNPRPSASPAPQNAPSALRQTRLTHKASPTTTAAGTLSSRNPTPGSTIETMTPDIIRKLTSELAEPITTERQVVYILCQVRKIVDRDSNKQRWKSLKLYCDWAMHPDLTFDSRTRPFIQEIENYLLATMSPEGTGVSQAQHAAI